MPAQLGRSDYGDRTVEALHSTLCTIEAPLRSGRFATAFAVGERRAFVARAGGDGLRRASSRMAS
jgi:hypothetical protein